MRPLYLCTTYTRYESILVNREDFPAARGTFSSLIVLPYDAVNMVHASATVSYELINQSSQITEVYINVMEKRDGKYQEPGLNTLCLQN